MSPSARDAVAAAGSGRGVIGWKLDPAQRAELLERFPARFAHVVADHVTLAPRAGDGAPLPDETAGRIVGIAVDDDGVEALVVEIDGTTYRPGGSTYHITWSLAEGRRAQESNDVIAARGWQALDEGVPVALRPARLR